MSQVIRFSHIYVGAVKDRLPDSTLRAIDTLSQVFQQFVFVSVNTELMKDHVIASILQRMTGRGDAISYPITNHGLYPDETAAWVTFLSSHNYICLPYSV